MGFGFSFPLFLFSESRGVARERVLLFCFHRAALILQITRLIV